MHYLKHIILQVDVENCSPEEACLELLELSKRLGCRVEADVNSNPLTIQVNPNTNLKKLIDSIKTLKQ